jgi:predicted metal-dependent hydrolase
MTYATAEWQTELRLPGGRVECTMRRSARARNMRVTVDPRMGTVVTIPVRSSRGRDDAERLAETFLGERERWLRRHLDRHHRQRETVRAFGPLGDGALVRYRGVAHRVRVVGPEPGRRRTTVTREGGETGDELVVALRQGERRGLSEILEAWLKEKARLAIHREIDRHAPALAVAPAAVTLRDTRTRWGSCSRSRRLSFSWRLVLAPPEALETVVIHELAHLRVFGHGPQFWEMVASRRPDHRHWRRWLRDHSLELHSALEVEEAA